MIRKIIIVIDIGKIKNKIGNEVGETKIVNMIDIFLHMIVPKVNNQPP